MKIVTVHTLDIPELKIYQSFRENAFRKDGSFVADSPNVVKLLLEAGIEAKSLLATPKYYETHKAWLDDCVLSGKTLRYSGGMVPDLHQILLKGGGIFSYPSTTDKPDGKLRILFEVLPFAMIYENAGGEAIDERGNRLLELKPKHHHDTTPCFFGSKYEINRLREVYGV